MAQVLGHGTGTSEVPPASKSCTYSLDDPRQPSVNIEQFTIADFADGWAGAKAHIAKTAVGEIAATPTEVANIGDGAIVVANAEGAGSVPDAIGLVLIGDTIVRATVIQGSTMTDAELTAVATGALRLIASKG